jgi:hypothetical protein
MMNQGNPPNSAPPDLSLAAGVALTVAALVATGAVAVALCQGMLPTGAGEWEWARRVTVLPWGLGGAVALLAALVLAIVVFDRLRTAQEPTRRASALVLVAILLLGLVVELGVALEDPTYPVNGGMTVLSSLAIGYYTVAAELPGATEAFTQDLARAANPAAPDRVRTHPPGPILFMMALRDAGLAAPEALDRLEDFLRRNYDLDGQWMAQTVRETGFGREWSAPDALVAVEVALVLTVLPVLLALPAYGLGTVLAGRRVGLAAAALTVTLPSVLCFAPGIDGLGAVLALTGLFLWAAALRRGDWWLYLLAGLGAAAALLWSFGYLALALPAAALALPRGEWRPARLGQGLIFTLAGLAVVYGALDAAFGYSLPAAMSAAVATQKGIMAATHRPYLIWLGMNAYGWVVFLGPGLALLAGAAWFTRGIREGGLGRLTEALVAALLVLLLAGTTRGEVERIWVFLMPLAALAAARLLGRFPPALRLWAPVALIVAQVALALALRGTFDLVKPY